MASIPSPWGWLAWQWDCPGAKPGDQRRRFRAQVRLVSLRAARFQRFAAERSLGVVLGDPDGGCRCAHMI